MILFIDVYKRQPLYFICDGKHRKERTPPAAQETAYAAPAAENHQKEPVEEKMCIRDRLIPAAELEKDICVEKAINLVRDNANIKDAE